MTGTHGREVNAGTVTRFHDEGRQAAEQFLQTLRRYSMTGSELDRVLTGVAHMESEKIAPWLRGFHGRIQVACQYAMDRTP